MNMIFMESQMGKHKTVPMSLSDEKECPGSVAAKYSLSQHFIEQYKAQVRPRPHAHVGRREAIAGRLQI